MTKSDSDDKSPDLKNEMSDLMNLLNLNKWDEIYVLIKDNKVNLEYLIEGRNNILHLAAYANKDDILEYISKHNPDLLLKANFEGNTCLHILAASPYHKLLHTLLNTLDRIESFQVINDKGYTIQHILFYDYNLIKLIIDKKYDINLVKDDNSGGNILHFNITATKEKDDMYYKVIELLLNDKKQRTYIDEHIDSFLSASVIYNAYHVAELLIKHSYDINKLDSSEMTPFLYSLRDLNKFAKLLIENGADINFMRSDGLYNAMIYYIERSDEEMIDLLFKNKFDVDLQSKYLDTTLHRIFVTSSYSPSIISKLIYYGDLNKINIDGNTPMHMLCLNYDLTNYTELLKNKKINISIKNLDHKIALDYVKDDKIKLEYLELFNQNVHKKRSSEQKIIKYTSKIKSGYKLDKIDKLKFDLNNKKVTHGVFNTDAMHNIIYTILLLKKYDNLMIPYQYYIVDKVINTIINSRDNLYVTVESRTIPMLFRTYIKILYELTPYLIMFSTPTEYYFSNKLKFYLDRVIKQENIRFILLKLSIITGHNSLHANILLYDKKLNRLERFEPYGVMFYDFNQIDDFVDQHIKPLFGSKTKYLNPKEMFKGSGFQRISNDSDNSYRKLDDPGGFCLAWTFFYIEIRIQNPDKPIDELIEQTKSMITFTNKTDTKDSLNTNFIDFIRNYSHNLDTLKNKYMLEAKVSKYNIYDEIQNKDTMQKLQNKLAKDFEKIIKDKMVK